MKLGLVRHFKVKRVELDEYVDWETYTEHMLLYDSLDVEENPVDLRGIDWNKCYASDLPRALTTAETIYQGKIKTSSLIREVPMHLVKGVTGKNHPMEWSLYALVNWMNGTSTMPESIDESRVRVNKFLDILEDECQEDDNVLVVCHGLIMMVLEEQLKKRGFKGDDLVFAGNGELYLYER